MRADRDDASTGVFPARLIAGFAPREPLRTSLKRTFPRRRARLVMVRTAADLDKLFRRELVDAVVVDVQLATAETWNALALAREFPSSPFFAITGYKGADGPTIARCAEHDVADLLAEGIDDAVVREIVLRDAFTSRFSRALELAPASLALTTRLQRDAWTSVVAHGGRVVQTDELARTLRVTREHLSRKFATGGAPNLKRVLDLVRLMAAAELCKNPGYDMADVASVLRFASLSHLATTTQRVVGTRPASLARLRAVDLVKRFGDGHARSRGSSAP